jgi:3D (Asp-Asp-Asp) domain-containing protein
MSLIISFILLLCATRFCVNSMEIHARMILFDPNTRIKLQSSFNFILGLITLFTCFLYVEHRVIENGKKVVKTIKVQKDSVQVDTIPFKKIKATYYNPTSEQCDKTPLITGSGYKINLRKLKNKEIKVVAVSRDLLKVYPYGSTIYVHQPVHLRGTYKVEDTMNKRFTNRVDFLVYDKITVDSIHISI